MKVIIVGAGFSGVATYLLLRRAFPLGQSIALYDAHDPRVFRSGRRAGGEDQAESEAETQDSAVTVGNIISLEAPAVRLLRFIDPKLYDLFKARSHVNHHYTLRSARGHELATIPTADGQLPIEHTLSCPRYDSWQWLHEHVGHDNISYRRVIAVDLNGERPTVYFADGGRDDADLVVGADGVRSVVKEALFSSHGGEVRYGPAFEGFLGVGGFIDDMDMPPSITELKSMVFTFGPAGSFGYCSAAPLGQRKLSWWSNWGSPDMPSANLVSAGIIKEQLLDRHAGWSDPLIRDIIQQSTTDRVYPVWTTPDLPHWGERGAVLLGDAAHALQATSGSGANQALEDAVIFSLLLSHYAAAGSDPCASAPGSSAPRDVADLASKGLFEIRAPRVAAIRHRSRNLYISNKRIENVVVEHLWYLWIYVQARFSLLIGETVFGFHRKRQSLDPEQVVRQYLQNKGY